MQLVHNCEIYLITIFYTLIMIYIPSSNASLMVQYILGLSRLKTNSLSHVGRCCKIKKKHCCETRSFLFIITVEETI